MQKVIIIDHEPLTLRRKQIFYIDQLFARGFFVEFWDCSSYFNKDMQLPDSVCESYVCKFETLTEISNTLKSIDCLNTLFIVEVFDNYTNRKFFRLLAKNCCYTVKQEMYATAQLENEPLYKRFMRMPLGTIFRIGASRLQAVYYSLYKKYFHIRYDLIISSGTRRNVDVYINHPDWELSQEIKEIPPFIKQPYAVFIDEFFPLHPDLLFFFHQKEGDAFHYHQVLNAFFDKVEKEHNLKVVIAAHPKSSYAHDVFNGREIIKYRTAELIKDAQMVFMHSSAALSFVIIFNKPLALLVTDDYKNTRVLYDNVLRISKLIELPVYNLEMNTKIKVEYLSSEIRKKYIYSYLTSKGIEDKKNADILAEKYAML